MAHNRVILTALAFIMLQAVPSEAKSFYSQWKIPGHTSGYTLSLDPYLTYGAVYFDMTTRKTVKVSSINELDIYKKLLIRSLLPRYALLQASFYPVPAASAYSEERWNGFYEWFSVTEKINVLKMISTGYTEPYCLSLFLGEIMTFWDENSTGTKQIGSAISGFVFTWAPVHMIDNVLINTEWAEAEWKLKGSSKKKDQKIDWYFRAGARIHFTPDYFNKVFISLYRDRSDRESKFSLFYNTRYGILMEFPLTAGKNISRDPGVISRLLLSLGKKFPQLTYRGVLPGFEAGAKYEFNKLLDRPTGTWKEEEGVFEFFVKPIVEF